MTGGESCSFFNRFGGQPLIIAHRGYRACYPENTLCAFEQSLGRCQMIELDVQPCADGVAVVFHDDTLTRTSDAAAVAANFGQASLALRDWPLAALRRLDIGTWFLAADPFGTIRRGIVEPAELRACMPQRVLTLREVLVWATANRLPLNVEIKDSGRHRKDHPIVPVVVNEIREAGATGLVLVSSFHHQFLRTCRLLAPEIALAALQEGGHPPDLLHYLHCLGVCAYHPENGITDATLVNTLRSAGLHVNVFTVNEPARQQQLFTFGVTGIFTDFPRVVS
ncbi:glycerophosphodiester phosphodiesterase family protein [uncultured Desulfobulbus sp.]|uniref:glycerophosphodiester phosphodiesterase n=1 Tax=uncultured Desulfobulbus sp. TaxID=239745 RepID=UPI0029C63303|nr:glycerophosphodiester phosphodiesterase family protein [uncultured Desulfobulbus sp.]